MPKLTIICDAETYRLSIGKSESDESEYGDPCFLTVGARTYMALVCEDEHGQRFSLLDGEDWAIEVKKGVEVEFEDAAGDSADDGDGAEDEADELEEDDDSGDDTDDDGDDPDDNADPDD